MAESVQPGLLPLTGINLNEPIRKMLAIRVTVATGLVPLTPQLALDELRGIEAL